MMRGGRRLRFPRLDWKHQFARCPVAPRCPASNGPQNPPASRHAVFCACYRAVVPRDGNASPLAWAIAPALPLGHRTGPPARDDRIHRGPRRFPAAGRVSRPDAPAHHHQHARSPVRAAGDQRSPFPERVRQGSFHRRTALDIGCGIGYFTRRFAGESGLCVVGLDRNVSWPIATFPFALPIAPLAGGFGLATRRTSAHRPAPRTPPALPRPPSRSRRVR